MDRNGLGIGHYRDDVSSLSARRAWIEIYSAYPKKIGRLVALRKESVDRNWLFRQFWSLSRVALRKESVDRNEYIQAGTGILNCRSPQGERG